MLSAFLLLLMSCKGDEPVPDDTGLEAASCDGGASFTWVMTAMRFSEMDDQGRTWGFDVDGHVSDSGDDEGCYKADFTDPDGNEGIDNAVSGLLSAVEGQFPEVSAVSTLIQDSINSGDLLLLFTVSGVDDLVNDDCVTVSVFRGEGEPFIGTDGAILDSQSFARSDLPPNSTVVDAAIVDGKLTAHGLDLILPVKILDVELAFNIDDASVRINLSEDDNIEIDGFFGGGVPKADVNVLSKEGDLGELADFIPGAVSLAADLFPDENGSCTELSIAFELEGTAAFFYGD